MDILTGRPQTTGKNFVVENLRLLFQDVYFFGSNKPFLTGFLRIFLFMRFPEVFFFHAFSGGFFSQECGFGEVAGNPFFFDFTGIFHMNSCGQEFLYLLRIPPDSYGFLFPSKAVWRRPATEEGSLLSTMWTKIDLINFPHNSTT